MSRLSSVTLMLATLFASGCNNIPSHTHTTLPRASPLTGTTIWRAMETSRFMNRPGESSVHQHAHMKFFLRMNMTGK